MVEFGEKIRRFREEKGYTLKKCVDSEPVLKKSPARYVEIILYAIAVFVYLIMIRYYMSVLIPNLDEEIHTFADGFLYMQAAKNVAVTILVIMGLILSLMNKMTSKKMGIIMGLYFVIVIIQKVVTYCYMEWMQRNMDGVYGTKSQWEFIAYIPFIVEIVTVIVIFMFFILRKNVISKLLYVLAGLQLIFIIFDRIMLIMNVGLENIFRGGLEEAVIEIIFGISKLIMLVLLVYETCMLKKKRTMGVNI